MRAIKKFIKNYFSSFAYFYGYLKNKIFISFLLSVAVGFLDSLGLTMFFPLLQVVGGGEGELQSNSMGRMGLLIEEFEKIGIPISLASILVIMVIFFSLKALAKYASDVYIIILQQRFIRSIRLNLLQKINHLSFKQFITAEVGRIQNTMTGEVDRVSRSFTTYFRSFQEAVMVAVYMGFAFFVNFQFAILVSIGGFLTNFLYKYIYTHTKGASRRLTRYNSLFQGQVIQYIAHFKYLKATGMAQRYAQHLRKTIYQIEYSRRKIGMLAGVSNAAREPMLVLVIAAVIFIQVRFFEGQMGTIIFSLLLFYRALSSLANLQTQWNTFMENSGSLENMQDFEKELAHGKEHKGEIDFEQLQSDIELRQVSFTYGQTPVLKDINLRIPKNHSVAFVGESGSGKTTLINLIAGLLPETEGEILLGDTPLKKLRRETYQARIGYVSQDPVIFNDSIFNNITFWAEPNAENRKRFEESITQASLADFIEQLPKGGDTILGHNGVNLSGGQKQRISIARELFKQIDLLILDEATSSLDSETEKNIQDSIDALKGKYTIIIVAHRLSTIRNAHQIIFMDRGQIRASGSFESLIQKEEAFRKMVELQEL